MASKQVTLTRCAAVLLAFTLPATPLAQAKIYKWVDKDGVTHYSDRPQPGASEIAVAPAQTYSAPQASSRSAAEGPAAPPTVPGAAPATPQDGSCELREPREAQVFLNVQSVAIRFRGPAAAKPVLMLNGKRYEAEAGADTIVIEPIPRGTYEAKLRFLNSQGGVVCSPQSVTFFVRQPTVIRRPKAG
jgi:hypothetical protein